MKASPLVLIPFVALVGCERSELHFTAPGVVINSKGTHFQASGDLNKLQQAMEATGPMTTETRSIGDFSSIDASSVVTVEYTQGDKMSVEVSAKKDILDKVTTNVSDGTLHLELEGGLINNPGPVTIKVTSPTLTGITASGSSTVHCTGHFSDEMKLDVSGASSVELAGSAPKLDLNLSGSGNLIAASLEGSEVGGSVDGASTLKLSGKLADIDLSQSGSSNVHLGGIQAKKCSMKVEGGSQIEADGQTDELKIETTGASTVNLPSLVSQECEVQAEGGCQVHVNAVKSLKADASGASTIGYTGKPFSVTPTTEGASSVKSDG